jgi:hypothetical protein
MREAYCEAPSLLGSASKARWRGRFPAAGEARSRARRAAVLIVTTDAGRRTVDLSPALRDGLAAHKATTRHAKRGIESVSEVLSGEEANGVGHEKIPR